MDLVFYGETCASWNLGMERTGAQSCTQNTGLAWHLSLHLTAKRTEFSRGSESIWPASDGLKLSPDLKLLIIWSLFLFSHYISLGTCLLSYFCAVPLTTRNRSGRQVICMQFLSLLLPFSWPKTRLMKGSIIDEGCSAWEFMKSGGFLSRKRLENLSYMCLEDKRSRFSNENSNTPGRFTSLVFFKAK